MHTAVVAGVGPGVGASVCKTLSQAGYHVALLARSLDSLQSLSSTLPNPSTPIQCDLSSLDSVVKAVDQIKSLPPVSVLVCNASGGFMRAPFLEVDIEKSKQLMQVQLWGTMRLPSMLKTAEKQPGTIIFTGATASVRGSANFSGFCTPKFAARGLAQSLAREFGPQNIHVCHVVLDGPVESEQTRSFFKDAPEDGLLKPDAIAKEYLRIVQQEKSTWTQELDLRPFCEDF